MTTRDEISEVPESDDWDSHWNAFGAAADSKPASLYRQRLMLRWLGPVQAGDTVLDIGSGQGEFTIQLKAAYPETSVWGVEHSSAGVERSRRAAAAAHSNTHFTQRDLLFPVELDPDQPPATHAVCSEVLEHVDEPAVLLRNASALLAPGCRLVITVPGGPRSAFDRHIGHRPHFSAKRLSRVISDAGLVPDRVMQAGAPFFNLYKTAAILRGRRLIQETENRDPTATPPRSEVALLKFFDRAFRFNLENSPFGWQLVAVAHVPAKGS